MPSHLISAEFTSRPWSKVQSPTVNWWKSLNLDGNSPVRSHCVPASFPLSGHVFQQGAPEGGHLQGAMGNIQLGCFLWLELYSTNRSETKCARHINYEGSLSMLMMHGICCKATTGAELSVWKEAGADGDAIWNLTQDRWWASEEWQLEHKIITCDFLERRAGRI